MKVHASMPGSVLAAICLGPLVLGALGGISIGSPASPWLLGLTGVFLAFAFYLAYHGVPRATWGSGDDGHASTSRRAQRFSVWIVAVLTTVLATSPQWSSAMRMHGGTGPPNQPVPAPSTSGAVTLDVKGMTCPHCEGHVKQELLRVQGVTAARVSFATQSAVVEVKSVDPADLMAAVAKAGYQATIATPH